MTNQQPAPQHETPAPQNLPAEEMVLGAILAAGTDATGASTLTAIEATGLRAGDFYRVSHGLLYDAARRVNERGEPTDVVVLAAELDRAGKLDGIGGEERLHELAGIVPATANAPHYARLVVDAAERREEVAFAFALRAAAENGGGLAADPVLRQRLAELVSRRRSTGEAAASWHREPWSAFRETGAEEHRWLVEGLLPAGMLAFVAGPPKKGKTWLGLGLSLAVSTGRPLFGECAVPEALPVLYVALEGSRVGLRTRIGALARGLGLDPDGVDLDRLTMLYRPRPFDLADLTTAGWLRAAAEDADAALVIVDVLRAAARFRENVAEDFAVVRDGLEPLLNAGRTIALLHHFGKLSETQKERSPGERMAGTGAMYGALDVGLLITRSESGARRLRVDVEARDFAAPDALGVIIGGTGSGEHGGFTYSDTATLALDPAAAEERDLAAELEQLFADGTWRTVTEAASKKGGIGANKDEVRAAFEDSPDRFVLLDDAKRIGRHGSAKPWGTVEMLRDLEQGEKVARASEPPEPPEPPDQPKLLVEQVASPKGESQPSHLPLDGSRAGAAVEPPEPPEVRGAGEPER